MSYDKVALGWLASFVDYGDTYELLAIVDDFGFALAVDRTKLHHFLTH